MNSARTFFDETLYDIELEDLYSLHAASNYSHLDKFCAVSLKLGDQMLNSVNESYRYLLIVFGLNGERICTEYL